MARVEVTSEVTGNVWQVHIEVGANVEAEDVILVLESMKMEIPVSAPEDGTIKEIKVAEGEVVQEGAVIAVLES